MAPESFVDSVAAAEFLSITPRRALDMARAGAVPAHPLGRGARKTWRFRLTELAASLPHVGANYTALTEGRTNRSQHFSNAGSEQ